MAVTETYLARARTDAEDRLIEADEPLAGLQLRAGGEIPGTIATPALLELVRKSRRLGLPLGQPIKARDDNEAITAWIEVTPEGGENGGCTLGLSYWQAATIPVESQAETGERQADIERHLAELTARLDPRQGVLTATALGTELEPLAERMRVGAGQPWTDFIDVEGENRGKVLHWRLLDGARARVTGSARRWKVSLVPLGGRDPGAEGFELLLTSEEAPRPAATAETAPAGAPRNAAIGREIAPVLRQPIARIIANAETIRTRLAGPLADQYSNYAADIAAAGQHLLSLIDDLSDLEVVESEDFTTAPDRIDLADVARRAAGILSVRAQERGISLDPPRADETVPAIGEFRRVLQVLLNLVGNAIRYTPGGSAVWLRAEHIGGRARVTVADQGEGLSEEAQARVFDKFERLGRSDAAGSGLGLYISRRLARAMGGELTVESAPGQGARFTLDLPADRY